MGKFTRVIVPGVAHHVPQRGVRSMPIFADGEDRQEYRRLRCLPPGPRAKKGLMGCSPLSTPKSSLNKIVS